MAAQGYVTLTLEAYPEGRSYVSRCSELGVTSCGDSLGDAIESLKDAVAAYLNAIEQLGDRDRIFEEKGIEVRKSKPKMVPIGVDRLPPNSVAGPAVFPITTAA